MGKLTQQKAQMERVQMRLARKLVSPYQTGSPQPKPEASLTNEKQKDGGWVDRNFGASIPGTHGRHDPATFPGSATVRPSVDSGDPGLPTMRRANPSGSANDVGRGRGHVYPLKGSANGVVQKGFSGKGSADDVGVRDAMRKRRDEAVWNTVASGKASASQSADLSAARGAGLDLIKGGDKAQRHLVSGAAKAGDAVRHVSPLKAATQTQGRNMKEDVQTRLAKKLVAAKPSIGNLGKGRGPQPGFEGGTPFGTRPDSAKRLKRALSGGSYGGRPIR